MMSEDHEYNESEDEAHSQCRQSTADSINGMLRDLRKSSKKLGVLHLWYFKILRFEDIPETSISQEELINAVEERVKPKNMVQHS
jgi:ATP-dependent DNA helicase RecQ